MSESDEYAIDAARFTDALREQRVMLDADLAQLYGVETKGKGLMMNLPIFNESTRG